MGGWWLLVGCPTTAPLPVDPPGTTDTAVPDCESRTLHLDADGDGFGDPAVAWDRCDDPREGVADGTDCDDADPEVNPAVATDGCDGVDADCDHRLDEDAPTPSWFADGDGDGWGDAPLGASCEVPDGGVDRAGDCDDAAPGVHPEAVDLCGDGVDSDCDGAAPCGVYGDAPLGSDGLTIAGAAAGERFGDRASPTGDLDGDGHPDLLVDSNDRVDLVRGDVAGTSADRWASLTLGSDPRSAPADLDGDGGFELVIGEASAGAQGAVWVVSGPLSGPAAVAEVATASFHGAGAIDLVGVSVARLGDTDGDGAEEVAVAAVGTGPGLPDVVLILGEAVGPHPVSDARAALVRRGVTDRAACCIGNRELLEGPGDVDGDGLADLLLGDRGEELRSGGYDRGRTDLLLAPFSGVADVATSAAATWVGEEQGDRAGYGVGAGDLDGDGLPEVAIGADLWDDVRGVVYVVPGSDRGTVALASATTRLEGAAPGDDAGRRFALPGDLDGDGHGDLAIDAGGLGVLYVVYGPVSGVVDLGAVPDRRSGTREWTTVDRGGDLNGDGFPDLLVGTELENGPAGADAGAIHVLLGGRG